MEEKRGGNKVALEEDDALGAHGLGELEQGGGVLGQAGGGEKDELAV